MTDPIQVERGNLQTLFDIIVSSLDYGSGFLEQEQIEILRRTAEQLGLNPMEGTPSNYARSYEHEYEAYVVPDRDMTFAGCRWCAVPSDKHPAGTGAA